MMSGGSPLHQCEIYIFCYLMMLLRGKGHACWLAALAGGLAGWLPGWLACLPFIADCMLIVAESQNVRNVFD